MLKKIIKESKENSDKKSILSSFEGMKNPDEMFGLICSCNYFAGQFGNNIPVEESREIFRRIKKFLGK
jgi:hypothetical protein